MLLEKETNFEQSDGVLVVGTSLTVFSAFRFIRHAKASNIPVAVVNMGETRADKDCILKVEQPVGEVLKSVVGVLATSFT